MEKIRTSRNIRYILIDATTGFIITYMSVPPATILEDQTVPDGQRMVIPEDGIIPKGMIKIDLRKCKGTINRVESIASVQASWRPKPIPAKHFLRIRQADEIARIDQIYADRIAQVAGPLNAVHAEKRRQAELGSFNPEIMPLIVDEQDRLAVLANARVQDERIAEIETCRRKIKAALKTSTSEDEINAALAQEVITDVKHI